MEYITYWKIKYFNKFNKVKYLTNPELFFLKCFLKGNISTSFHILETDFFTNKQYWVPAFHLYLSSRLKKHASSFLLQEQ